MTYDSTRKCLQARGIGHLVNELQVLLEYYSGCLELYAHLRRIVGLIQPSEKKGGIIWSHSGTCSMLAVLFNQIETSCFFFLGLHGGTFNTNVM